MAEHGAAQHFYAHTLEGHAPDRWQPLADHLEGVAARSYRSGSRFDAGEITRLIGLWHDLGKYSDAFQDYLRSTSPDPHRAEISTRIDHASAGAQHAVESLGLLGHLLAYPIAGHHSGLLDGRRDTACQERRLAKELEPWTGAPQSILDAPAPRCPDALAEMISRRDGFGVAFFVRMIFSALVDADFLDTEAFMRPDCSNSRPTWPSDVIRQMRDALDQHLAGFDDASEINQIRRSVLRACVDASTTAPGFFSLTVPTGGGKTLSSLAFALRHALEYGMERVIYVAPFTTIIEQNADVFRAALGSLSRFDPVLEHHSALDAGRETVTSRLATENWDAPLIVTTSVQFYESLFACRTSRARKLHRIARSVIILDEAQALPIDVLQPSLRALSELTERYGSTVVLCTATQPSVEFADDFQIGLKNVREIVPDPGELYSSLRRTRLTDLGRVEDPQLVDRLAEHSQVLCVVNTRSHARTLFDGLGPDPARFHLSARMCPAHRSAKIASIRARLDNGEPCQVVSTQLIEAGVDLDFPVVFRSLAGLDSLAQAAGRCNRNGRLPALGRVFLFQSEHVRSERYFNETRDCAIQVLSLHEDPLSIDSIEEYFRLYYWQQSARWDQKQLMDEFTLVNDRSFPFLLNFKTAADKYQLIEDDGKPVIVPWGETGGRLCARLRSKLEPPDRNTLRALQRFTVQVPSREWQKSLGTEIELVHDRYPVLVSPELCYSEETGLSLDGDYSVFLNG